MCNSHLFSKENTISDLHKIILITFSHLNLGKVIAWLQNKGQLLFLNEFPLSYYSHIPARYQFLYCLQNFYHFIQYLQNRYNVHVPIYVIVMPRVQVPKTERIRRPQQCKSMKGFYFQLELGLLPHPTQWSGARSPEPRFTAVFIGLRTESWQGLIGCSSFLVFTNWLIFIGCRDFLVFTNWLLAAGGCLLRPDKLKPGYGEYVD